MALARSLAGSLVKPLAAAITGASGADPYAANGFSPDYVADFSATSADFFRVAGVDSDFSTAFTSDSEGGGLATQVDSSGKLVWRPHNFVLNSATPATQDITVVSGADYTVEITGTGSVTLSGAGTGTVTDGNPVEITASTTTLTLTVTGSPSTMWAYRSDLGGMANNPDTGTSYVPTTSAARYLARRRHHRWDGSAYVPTCLHEPVGPVTNSCDESRTFDGTGTWNNSSMSTSKDEVGIDGQANTATTCTDSSGAAYQFARYNESITSDTAVRGFSAHIKKTVGALTVLPGIQLQYQSGGSVIYAVSFNTTTGVATEITGKTGATVYVEEQEDYWRVSIFGANSSATSMFSYLFPALTTAAAPDTETVSAQGSAVFDQVDVYAAAGTTLPSSPIPTNGSTVTRTADTLKGKAASFPWSSTAVSMAIKGRHNRVSGAAATLLARYEDADDALELRVDSSNNAQAYAETAGASQTAAGGAVATGADAAFSLAMRYVAGSAIQVARGGTAGSEVTASVPATPPLSDDDVLILEGSGTGDVNGTVDRIIGWDEDIAAAGLEETTA